VDSGLHPQAFAEQKREPGVGAVWLPFVHMVMDTTANHTSFFKSSIEGASMLLDWSQHRC
jgi:hypothetical protein